MLQVTVSCFVIICYFELTDASIAYVSCPRVLRKSFEKKICKAFYKQVLNKPGVGFGEILFAQF